MPDWAKIDREKCFKNINNLVSANYGPRRTNLETSREKRNNPETNPDTNSEKKSNSGN